MKDGYFMKDNVIHLKSKDTSVSISRLPVTSDSYPFNAADRQYVPVDLGSSGYIEEEFIISGRANIYQWYYSFTSPATVKTSDSPYTTRILVRRPEDPKRFSGNVMVEPFNWAEGYDKPWGGWGESWSYFLAHDDAWVGITIRPSSVIALKNFNPERYSPLSFKNPVPLNQTCPNPGSYPTPSSPLTEDGLAWDIISNVGALMRNNSASSPMAGYRVDYVYACGATGGDLSAYVSAIHPLAKFDNGKPIFDGYVIKCTGSPGSINQCEPKPKPDDPRCKLYADVPIIRVQTQGDIFGVGFHPDWSYLQRRPDGDKPGEQFRLYEVAGSYTQNSYPRRAFPCKDDVIAAKIDLQKSHWEMGEVPEHEFPLNYIMNGAFANLDLWVRKGVLPPRADRLSTIGEYPDVKFALDAYGNIQGGVRTPFVDVPLAVYTSDSKVIPLKKETLKQLYPTHGDYVRKVIKSTDSLLKERWVTETDAEAIKEKARNALIP
jgi:hypothetical protein